MELNHLSSVSRFISKDQWQPGQRKPQGRLKRVYQQTVLFISKRLNLCLMTTTMHCLHLSLVKRPDSVKPRLGAERKARFLLRVSSIELLSKPDHKYTKDQREFALTLHLHGPKAYSYLRESLHLNLPHPHTLQKFCGCQAWPQHDDVGHVEKKTRGRPC
ncbi:hypothetical protein ANANG_G00065140 [Anguilla anguilla]|uniref:THAP9-like helix-turn-helix domain-containing protein n=1 Tax=Anguilla anguilla TaxID=7936 RepID=A0A9D3MRH3_ANGAN|nr:hypothetical protein ANANG_G00065140 [Anguilla anguilla]